MPSDRTPTAATSAPVATLSRMSTAPTTREPTPEAADLQLTLVSHDWKRTGEKPYQSIYVAGSAKNTGSKKISSGFVEVKWFDKARNVLGTSLGSADNLEPGETMRFEIMYIGSTPAAEVDSYKISVDKLYNYDGYSVISAPNSYYMGGILLPGLYARAVTAQSCIV